MDVLSFFLFSGLEVMEEEKGVVCCIFMEFGIDLSFLVVVCVVWL